MPEMLAYSACGLSTKNKERIQKFKEAGDWRYIYQKELGKACFQHDMTYGDFKELTRRIASDKILRDKALNISKNPKYDGYQMVHKVFNKKTSGGTAKKKNISNKKLAEELQKPNIKKLKSAITFYRQYLGC